MRKPTYAWQEVGPVLVQMWAGDEPSPGADVARVGPVQVQISAGWAQSRCRCVGAGVRPVPVQMWAYLGRRLEPLVRRAAEALLRQVRLALAEVKRHLALKPARARARAFGPGAAAAARTREGRIGEVRWRPRKARRHRFGWVRRTLPSPSVARGHGRV